MRIRQLTAGLYISTALATSNASATLKNVVFGVGFGSSSHITWVLDIMDELAMRGHNVTFAARDDFIRFGEPFERIKSVKIGDKYSEEDTTQHDLSGGDMIKLATFFMDVRTPVYASQYISFKTLFRAINADVIICDQFTSPCEDAAKSLGLPFITTCTIAGTPDARVPYVEDTLFTLTEPTSLTMSFALRFYNHFIFPFRMLAALRKPLQRNMDVRKEAGAPPFSFDPWKDSLKIINSAFGFEPPRPLGPLVEMVGPIVQQKYSPLSPELSEYLDGHSRIAYIAFGQTFAPTKESLELILGVLLDNLDKGVIDGFLWATVVADTSKISNNITLPSGRHYDITEILGGKNPHCRLVKRISQQAVLQHPAISVFLTHGGHASLTESLLHGVRPVVFPIAGDQPFNARTVVNTGLGGSFDRSSSLEQASKTLETVVLDVTGEIRENVERYQHFVRIRSARGASKGADLVEEVAFMHQGGRLPHRYEASRQMSYFKSTNLDLYAALILVVVGTAYGCWCVVKALTRERKSVLKKKIL